MALKSEAALIKARIEAEQAANHPARSGILETLATIAHAWGQAKVGEGNHPTHTAHNVARLVSFFDRWGFVDVADITPDAINAIRRGDRTAADPPVDPLRPRRRVLKWSPRTGAMVRALLTWAADHRHASVDRSVLVALRPQERPRSRPNLVTETTAAQWLARAADQSPSAHALMHCLLLYGWRPISAARLTVGDLDIPGARLRTEIKSRKGTRPHIHALRPETVSLLAPLIEGRRPTDPLFIDPRTGDGFTETGSHAIPQWWRDHMGDLGGQSYDGKRFACTRLLRIAPATEARFITGHASARQLELYATTNDDRSREIINAVPTLPVQKTRGRTVGERGATNATKSKKIRAKKAAKSA